MQLERKLAKSIQYHLALLFSDPLPDSGFSKAFTIYGEQDMRRAGLPNSNWTGTRPFIFIVDEGARFMEQQRPGITVEIPGSIDTSYEMGNTKNMSNVAVVLHIVGRTRGEVVDFARYIANHLSFINIYDYDQAGEPPPVLERAMTLEDIIIEKVEPDNATAIKGSFAHQIDLSFGVSSFHA